MGNQWGGHLPLRPPTKMLERTCPQYNRRPCPGVFTLRGVCDILSRAGLWRQPRRRQDTFQTRSQNTVHCNNFTQPAVSSFPYVSCRRTRDTARIRRRCWAPGDRRCPSISPACTALSSKPAATRLGCGLSAVSYRPCST